MTEGTHKDKLIWEVTHMAYMEGLEEGIAQKSKTLDKEINRIRKESYEDGYAAGKRDALKAIKETAHSHQPHQNIYASRYTAFERRPDFVESAPELCGNCVHWEHEPRSDHGRCDVTDELRLSCIRCNVMRA